MKEQPMDIVHVNWNEEIVHVVNTAIHVATPIIRPLEAGRL